MRSVLSAALRPAHALAALSAPMAAVPAAASAATGCAARLAFTRGFHASAAAALAAPAAAAAKPAAGGKGAAAASSGPPAPGSARYVREGWGQATLVPPVQPATKTAEEAAADAAELEASRVLPELHAEVRERTGSKYSAELRGQHLRIPGIVQDRSNPRGNQLLISMDRFELEKLCRKYRRSVRHRVCLLHIKGQPEPIKVIPDEFPRHAVTQDLLACNWFLFKPRREKVRVTMPIVFTGADECIGVKRGGVLVILRDAVPCVWTGDENVPPFIHIDLTNADGGKVSVLRECRIQLFSPCCLRSFLLLICFSVGCVYASFSASATTI
jgi:large subunit ribosomal protein L25